MLRREFGARWKIRRTENYLVATARDSEAPHARTLIEPLERISAFVEDMADPPRGFGGSILSSSAFREQFEEVERGVYYKERPHP